MDSVVPSYSGIAGYILTHSLEREGVDEAYVQIAAHRQHDGRVARTRAFLDAWPKTCAALAGIFPSTHTLLHGDALAPLEALALAEPALHRAICAAVALNEKGVQFIVRVVQEGRARLGAGAGPLLSRWAPDRPGELDAWVALTVQRGNFAVRAERGVRIASVVPPIAAALAACVHGLLPTNPGEGLLTALGWGPEPAPARAASPCLVCGTSGEDSGAGSVVHPSLVCRVCIARDRSPWPRPDPGGEPSTVASAPLACTACGDYGPGPGCGNAHAGCRGTMRPTGPLYPADADARWRPYVAAAMLGDDAAAVLAKAQKLVLRRWSQRSEEVGTGHFGSSIRRHAAVYAELHGRHGGWVGYGGLSRPPLPIDLCAPVDAPTTHAVAPPPAGPAGPCHPPERVGLPPPHIAPNQAEADAWLESRLRATTGGGPDRRRGPDRQCFGLPGSGPQGTRHRPASPRLRWGHAPWRGDPGRPVPGALWRSDAPNTPGSPSLRGRTRLHDGHRGGPSRGAAPRNPTPHRQLARAVVERCHLAHDGR